MGAGWTLSKHARSQTIGEWSTKPTLNQNVKIVMKGPLAYRRPSSEIRTSPVCPDTLIKMPPGRVAWRW